jgi:hypothetical protein
VEVPVAVVDEPLLRDAPSSTDGLAFLLRRHLEAVRFGEAGDWTPAERRFLLRLSAALAAFETGSGIVAPGEDGRVTY